MSKLLIQEPPIQLLPSLAVAIGLNEAIVIQQLHYWLENKKCEGKVIDGKKYIYAAYPQWKQDNFPFWSLHTIRNLFCKLEKDGLIVSGRFSKDKYDQTKHYRINYDAPIFDSSTGPNLTPVNRNLTETTSETTNTPGIEKAPIPGTPQDDIRKVVGNYDPDEENKLVRKKAKCKKSVDPKLFPWAKEISILCCMPLGNGADGELFRAAKTLMHGEFPPRSPSDLRPIFAKNGKFFAEWPSRVLHPMDIPKHWPRLSGAVKPPEAAPDHATNADLLAQGYKL